MSRAIEVDTKTFFRFWLVIAAIIVGGLFLWRARTGLIIVFVALFLAVAINPLAKKIDRIDKSHERRTLTVVLAVSLVLGVIGTVIAVAGPMVVGETTKFLSQAPETVQQGFASFGGANQVGEMFGIEDFSEQVVEMVKKFTSNFLSDISGIVVSSVSAIAGLLTSAVLVIVLTILFLTQGPGLLESFWKKVEKRDSETGKVLKRVVTKIADVVAKYVTGQVMVAAIDGCVVGLTIFIMSLIFGFSSGFAIPMALISMVFILVPMFGAILACAIITLLLLFQSPAAGISFLVFYVIYQQVENNIIAPKIQGNTLQLPTLAILIAMTIGMYMFGLLGVIVSIPIAGVIKVLVDEYPNLRKLRSS